MRQRIPVRRRDRVIGWLVIGSLAACVLLAVPFAVTTQCLPRARVGIVGSFDTPPAQPVTVSASLPTAYGLPVAERDWDPLNAPQGEDAGAVAATFTLEFPKAVSYCTRCNLWSNEPPPPPATFILRLSDAPRETYYVTGSGYTVADAAGDVPREHATWRLHIGELERGPDTPGERARLWLLRVRFERQPSPESAEERRHATGAAAGASGAARLSRLGSELVQTFASPQQLRPLAYPRRTRLGRAGW